MLAENQKSRQQQNAVSRGFTMVEMMVVVSIIAVLVTILLPVVIRSLNYGKYVSWLAMINDLKNKKSCVYLVTFQEGDFMGFGQLKTQTHMTKYAAWGKSTFEEVTLNMAGRIKCTQKTVDADNVVSSQSRGNERDFGLIINTAMQLVDLSRGDGLGRFDFKSPMIFNETSDDATGLILEDAGCTTIFKEDDREFTVYGWIYPYSYDGVLLARESGYVDAAPYNPGTGMEQGNFEWKLNAAGGLDVKLNLKNLATATSVTLAPEVVPLNEWSFVCVRFEVESDTNDGKLDVWVNDTMETDDSTFADCGLLRYGKSPPIFKSTDKLWISAAPLCLGATCATDIKYADVTHSDGNAPILDSVKHNPGNGFEGRIGEFGLFNEALTNREIKQIYQAGKP